MRKHAAAGLSLLLGLTFSQSHAAPGEYWEITNKMEMQGMSMPGMTNKVCVPKGGEKDPRNSADKDCELTDIKTSGNRTSWKMRCNKNGEVMTGSGDMSATPDRTEGTINVSSAKTGNMTMSFVNKRIGGACDSEEMKKKADAQMAAINKDQARMCDEAKTPMDWYRNSAYILNKGTGCYEKKDQFCEIMRRESGRDIDLYFNLKRSGLSIPKECGLGMDTARKALCKSVDANNADFTRQLRGGMGASYQQQLRSECPAEMKTYAELSRKRYCEGRGFTEKQRVSLEKCLKGGSGDDMAMQTADPEEPPVPANAGKPSGGIAVPGLPGTTVTPDAVIDGAKKLKNLFGL